MSIEAMKLARKAMASFQNGTNGLYEGEFDEEIAALDQAITEAEQVQPVVTVRVGRDENHDQTAEFSGWHKLPDGEHILCVRPPPPRQPEQEELQATERQVEILTDALAESRKINAELLEVLKTCTGVTHWPVIAHIIAKHSGDQA